MIYKGRDAEGREVALKFVRVDKGDAMPGISASSVQREVRPFSPGSTLSH